MDFDIVNALLSVLGICGFSFAIFIIPSICYLLDNLSSESAWRTRKIAEDLGYIRVTKKFLFFKYYIFVKSDNHLTN